MFRPRTLLCLLAILTAFAPALAAAQTQKRPPNLIVIQTDEHNFRTLGCYRKLMTYEQAHVWGRGVRVETPHIDSIASQGAIFPHFYAASPVCTPSRASFLSGLYPQATGAIANNKPLKSSITTFAEVLRQHGYSTSYVGKWHLDGTAKPGFAPARKFGFTDNRYMFNRGHWKLLKKTKDGAMVVTAKNKKKKGGYYFNIEEADEKSFTTDFLTDRALEIIERDKHKPFCVMLALPDPHGPNLVRRPYDTMYQNFRFQRPRSMQATLDQPKMVPKWNVQSRNAVKQVRQDQMAKYFGMVRCIDDNVGRILKYLRKERLWRDTIIVFTSDHGDMMCEHCRLNKGLPYETSAGIPFVVRYPAKIPAGKIINTAHTTVDFMPTVLSLMEIEPKKPLSWHGRNATPDLLSEEKVVGTERAVYIRQSAGRWVAAITRQHKLVLSADDRPWLFDLTRDPDELMNQYDAPAFKQTATKLQNQLVDMMRKYKEPAVESLKYK